MVTHKYTIHAYMHLEREIEFYELLTKSKFKDGSWILHINGSEYFLVDDS